MTRAQWLNGSTLRLGRTGMATQFQHNTSQAKLDFSEHAPQMPPQIAREHFAGRSTYLLSLLTPEQARTKVNPTCLLHQPPPAQQTATTTPKPHVPQPATPRLAHPATISAGSLIASCQLLSSPGSSTTLPSSTCAGSPAPCPYPHVTL